MRHSLANIIFETTSIIEPNNLQIITEEESSAPDGSPINKVIFKAVLQTAEEQNQNGRYYTREILQKIVNILQPKANARALFQEIDHPFVAAPSSDPMIMKKRAITVELKNAASLIRDLYMDGRNVIGEIETLSGFKGPDLYNLIVNDKATIGFSVRMFGRLVKDPSTGRAYVNDPIRPVTYDVVTNPSHKGSVVMEFLPEDVSEISNLKDQSLLTEDINLIQESDNLCLEGLCCSNTVNDYIQSLLEETYKSIPLVKFNI